MRYCIPSEPVRHVTVIKRSRFITTLNRAASPEAARERIAEVRAEFPTANHNCFAFVAGPPGESRRIGCSDDGEPRGTAGKPMLQVLLNCGVGEIVAVVTRYFGGTKLGKGGLVKAYTQAVQSALSTLPTTEWRERVSISISCSYATLHLLQHRCRQFDALIRDTRFGERVTVTIEVAVHLREALLEHLRVGR
ncbi:MAG: YigZ family protein [Desulfosarcinaceae bacterium]|nr:YigZ family protein [Desulfosarcinaceae bacterium]